MKKFNETYNNIKLNLSKFDTDIQEKLSNLNGKPINECCDMKCCDTTCCLDCECPSNLPIKFYGEDSIINKLKTDVKVQDIFNIINQFNMEKFRSIEVNNILYNSPLFFNEQSLLNGLSISNSYFKEICNSKTFNNFIKSLMKNFGLNYPIVLYKNNGECDIYFVKHTGTNGKEGSIKNSLKEIYDLMNKVEECPETSYAYCADISIDKADDVYEFLIVINLDNLYLMNSIKNL